MAFRRTKHASSPPQLTKQSTSDLYSCGTTFHLPTAHMFLFCFGSLHLLLPLQRNNETVLQRMPSSHLFTASPAVLDRNGCVSPETYVCTRSPLPLPRAFLPSLPSICSNTRSHAQLLPEPRKHLKSSSEPVLSKVVAIPTLNKSLLNCFLFSILVFVFTYFHLIFRIFRRSTITNTLFRKLVSLVADFQPIPLQPHNDIATVGYTSCSFFFVRRDPS